MKRNWKVAIASALTAAMVITTAPVTVQNAQAATKVKKITLSKKTCVIQKGKKVKLKASYSPKKAKGKITWKTSNKKIATVSKKGVVTAKKKGKATITAKLQGKKATCKVIVGTPVKSVSVAKKSISVAKGKNVTIKAKVLPAKASVKKLTYTSSNKKVATVSGKGVVTGKAKGKTIIKVASTDGSGKSAKVTVSVTENTTIAVTGISMTEAFHTMNVAETYQAKATVTPANATNKNVVWSSTNSSVVTVSQSGLVTSVGKGTADVVATTVSGNLSAKCTITVAAVAHVSTDEQIAAALKTSPDYLYLETTEQKKLTIPEGVYQNTNLIVDMPNGEVVNNGTFASVTIKNIAKNTFEEYASGNTLTVEAANSHIIVAKSANTKIKIAKTASSTQVENNGSIQNLEIASEGDVTVGGDANSIIPTTVTSNVNLVTNQNMQIEAIAKFFLKICPGAENTTIAVDTVINIPKIVGLGLIPVTVSDSGDVVTVISDNLGVDENAVDVAFQGDVQNEENVALSGADVYVVPYTADYDLANIESDAKTIHMVTDENGKYSENTIKTGNYILVVKKDGYMTVTQNLVITSVYGSIYTNELINLLPASWEGKEGGVSGAVTDSKTGNKVSGLTMRIRKGKNNLLQDALKETKTDESGKYLFENLGVGYYTIQVLDQRALSEGDSERYLSTSFNVLIKPDVITENQGVGVSTAIHTGQVRFILTWGDEESGAIPDADSHLVGPIGQDGTRFHTYYAAEEAICDDELYADLDLDDTEYEGPETTTIYKEVPGKYSFYIHDYTNRRQSECSQLAASNVKVEVYSGSFKMATYYMPNKPGTLWHVCDYDSRTKALESVNDVTYQEEPKYVGKTDEEIISIEKEGIGYAIEEVQDVAEDIGRFQSETEAKIAEFKDKNENANSIEELSELRECVDAYSEKLYNIKNYDNSIKQIQVIADRLGNGKTEVVAKIAEFDEEESNANTVDAMSELSEKAGKYYSTLYEMFCYSYDVTFTGSDYDIEKFDSGTLLKIVMANTNSITDIDIKPYDGEASITEVTPGTGMWKAYQITAANGYKLTIQVEVKKQG